MSGLSILNVGEGDTKLTFTPGDAAERSRCARIVRDMLRRGYVLLVKVDREGEGAYQRVRDFDDATCEYIIADIEPEPDLAPPLAAAEGETHGPGGKAEARAAPAAPGRRRGGRRAARTTPLRRLPASSSDAVAVAPSAGG